MKHIFILFALIALSLTQAQSKASKMAELRTKFRLEQEGNKTFLSQKAQKKGISVESLNESLVGKIGNFLLYIDPLDTDQILATNTDFLYNNTIADVAVKGEGMVIYQWDSGRVQANHPEFEERVTNLESEDISLSDHSTAVAGVMVAAGINSPSQGLAPLATVMAYDFDNNNEEMLTESANNQDYMISNHSYGYQAGWRWGDYDEEIGEGWYWFGYPDMDENESVYHGIYSPLDEDYDQITHLYPNHLIVKSAGNDRNVGPQSEVEHAYLNFDDEWETIVGYRPANCAQTGYDCLPYSGVAKNILLVGSINQISNSGRYIGPESVTPSSFTSFGPTDDGRIKPDLVSQGSSVYIPVTNDSYYGEANGTSFSAPSVTGIATLLQQLYYELNSEYMNAAQLKAVLINTTNETGDNPGPDYKYGFGLVDAFQAANLIVNDYSGQAIILKDVKGDEEQSYNLITTGSGPIKATLVWSDPAKDASTVSFALNDRAPVLVNDLDLRIIENSSLTSYLPWTLDVENPSNAAVPGDNIIDNVEQIVIENPTSTEYTLTVNHKDLLEGDIQTYAIALTGATLETQGITNFTHTVGINIYPNPVMDVINFKGLDLNDNNEVHIYSLDGQVVKSLNLTDNSINVNELKTGGYILIIKNSNQTFVDKFIKK